MGRGRKDEGQPKLSLRDRIVQYRGTLHGDHAIAFDEVFYEVLGVSNEGGIRKALNKNTGNPNKAFTTAKAAVEALGPQKTNEDEYSFESPAVKEGLDEEIDWNDPALWNKQGK